jgi:hypothetical protein
VLSAERFDLLLDVVVNELFASFEACTEDANSDFGTTGFDTTGLHAESPSVAIIIIAKQAKILFAFMIAPILIRFITILPDGLFRRNIFT